MGRKLTNDEYKDRLNKENPTLILVGDYVDSKTKVSVECTICGHSFESFPQSLLRGHGCPKCANANRHSKQVSTHDIFIEKLKNIQPSLRVLGHYYNSKTKLEVECTVCGNTYNASPSNLLKGYSCRKCYLTTRSRTKDEFQALVDKKNPNIIVGDDFVGGKTKSSFTCIKCGYTRQVIPNLFLSKGCTCPKCDGNVKLTTEEFIEKVASINKDVVILSEYNGAASRIDCECIVCGNKWNTFAYNFIFRNASCPNCQRKKAFEKRRVVIRSKFMGLASEKNPNIVFLSDYYNVDTKIDCSCKICGHKWNELPTLLELRDFRCPSCQTVKSKLETEIEKYLKCHNIHYETQKKYSDLLGVNSGLLSYDFYLSDANLLIEAQGIQHDTAVDHFGGQDQFKVQKEHDRRKKEYALNHNIGFLEIWYHSVGCVDSILDSYFSKIA